MHLWFEAVSLVAVNAGEVPPKQLEANLGVSYKTARRMSRLIPTAPESLLAALSAGAPRAGSTNGADPAVWSRGDICTAAGDGTQGYGGDGGPATAAQLNSPYGVAVDDAGNLFISDEGNHVVRMVDRAGTITTVAGTGAPGYSGDGGPAREARLRAPQGIAVDDAGNLLIAEAGNHVIRRVDRAGRISTFAGTGKAGYSGDGGPAVDAEFSGLGPLLPFGPAVAVADYGNGRVRRIDEHGRVSTVAGNGGRATSGDGGQARMAGIVRPSGLAVDGEANLYVTQVGDPLTPDARVRKIAPSGEITTVAGSEIGGFGGDGGPATRAMLCGPTSVVFHPSLGLLICELYNNRVRRVDASGIITTIVGTGHRGFGGNGGPASGAQLNRPIGMALGADGDLFIADTLNHRVRRVVGVATD